MEVKIVKTRKQAEVVLKRGKIPAELWPFFIKVGHDGQVVAEIGAAKAHLEKLGKPDPEPKEPNPRPGPGNFTKGRKSPWLTTRIRNKDGETISRFICRLINKGATNFEICVEVKKEFGKTAPTRYPRWYRGLMRRKGTLLPLADFTERDRPKQWGIYKGGEDGEDGES